MSDFKAPTGAVRSNDLKGERWDLLSGPAFKMLRVRMGDFDIRALEAPMLVDMAVGKMYQALAGAPRAALLAEGWAYLAMAIEAEEGVPHRPGMRYPLALMRRTAAACHEGAVKYGEENWHNGFRLKVLCNHAIRHMVRWANGAIEDDELGHASWGFMAAIHTALHRPNLCDLLVGPDYAMTDELKAHHAEVAARRAAVKADATKDWKVDLFAQVVSQPAALAAKARELAEQG